MTYQFKKFENIHQRLEPRITVTKSASIGFPTKFYKDNNVKDFKYVVLFYDEVERALGIHFGSDEAEKNKFTIIHSNDGYGGSIVARSFFKNYALDAANYRGKYEYEKIAQEGIGDLFVIKLVERTAQPITGEEV